MNVKLKINIFTYTQANKYSIIYVVINVSCQ